MDNLIRMPFDQWYLVRGLTRESGHWLNFPKQLEECFYGAQALRLDLPGTGIHFDQKSPLTISAIVDQLRRDFQTSAAKTPEKEVNKRFLLSISMGAMVAIDWICRYPKDFSGAVMINPSVSSLSPIYKRLRWQALPKIMRALTTSDRQRREKYILEVTSNLPEHFDEIALQFEKIQREHPVSRENFFRQLLAAATFRLPSAPPKIPLLLLTSAGDRLVDPSCSQTLKQRWALSAEIHTTAGHDLPLDDPRWILNSLRRWRSAL